MYHIKFIYYTKDETLQKTLLIITRMDVHYEHKKHLIKYSTFLSNATNNHFIPTTLPLSELVSSNSIIITPTSTPLFKNFIANM